MRPETIVQRLEAEQTKLAHEALAKPAGYDAFAYGKAIGFYAGLEHAKNTVLGVYAEDEDRGRRL